MTDREYVFRTKADRWSQPVGLGRHMSSARQRVLMKQQPFILTQDGDPISSQLKREAVIDRYEKAVKDRELGATFRIRRTTKDRNVVFTGRSVKDKPDSIDINGNRNADEFWGWVVNNYPTFKPRFAGSYVCKSIAGSGGVSSQHSYGNAVDVFFGSIAQQEIVFRDITNRKCPVPVAHAISLRRIWEPGSGIHGYSGIPHYHLHADFSPQYSGSCGVRG
jgi:hypothetical protein